MKKGALLIGGIVIIANLVVAIGGVLLTEFVVNEYSLKGLGDVQQAKTQSVCSSLLLSAIGEQYAINTDIPDSSSSAELLNAYNEISDVIYGFTEEELKDYENKELYIQICTGTQEEVELCSEERNVQKTLMECYAQIYHPSGKNNYYYMKIGQYKIFDCELRGGSCLETCESNEVKIDLDCPKNTECCFEK